MPGGTPARCSRSAKKAPESGASSAVFSTIVQPAARQGASFSREVVDEEARDRERGAGIQRDDFGEQVDGLIQQVGEAEHDAGALGTVQAAPAGLERDAGGGDGAIEVCG